MTNKKSEITLTHTNPFEAILALFDSEVSSRMQRISANKFISSIKSRNFNFNFNRKNLTKYIIPVIVVLILAYMVKLALTPASDRSIAGITNVSDSKPLKSVNLNREFKFPLKDEKGKEVGKLSYLIESAELRKQIIVKGKRATAIDGRMFLIINIKIINSLSSGLEINSRDYIRVTVNGDEKELFAPDIHNDPVEVQAISTKNSRLGLTINDGDRDIKLQVGEINGKKEIISLSL